MVTSFEATARRRAMRSRVAPVLAAMALSLAATGPAWSHAHLKSAVPAVDSTVRSAPERVSVSFTERLEPKLSRLTVTDASGRRVDKDDATVARADGKRLSVGLKALTPGTYTVLWEITSVDTHRTSGQFTFIIKHDRRSGRSALHVRVLSGHSMEPSAMTVQIDIDRRRLALGGATLVAFSLSALQPAQAHVRFRSSRPAADEALAAAPAEIVLIFSDRVQPALSRIVVTDEAGARVDKAPTGAVAGDATRLGVGLNPLAPGRYKVAWAATCIYNHNLSGNYSFVVKS